MVPTRTRSGLTVSADNTPVASAYSAPLGAGIRASIQRVRVPAPSDQPSRANKILTDVLEKFIRMTCNGGLNYHVLWKDPLETRSSLFLWVFTVQIIKDQLVWWELHTWCKCEGTWGVIVRGRRVVGWENIAGVHCEQQATGACLHKPAPAYTDWTNLTFILMERTSFNQVGRKTQRHTCATLLQKHQVKKIYISIEGKWNQSGLNI